MKKPSVQDMVLKKTLPNPKANDPTTFFGHVQRNLVPEVRHEVQVFYGSLDCIEAQYPGLDYTYGPHRQRLGRYPWHKRLFRTFDELALTDHEILSLCQWEGTRSAKERYEVETKRTIRDTTADGIAPGPAYQPPRAKVFNWEEPAQPTIGAIPALPSQMEIENEVDQSDEDETASSIGVQLNQQLQAAVEARSRGEDATVDAQWEQWMKEAIERNDLDRDSILQAVREGRLLSRMSSATGNGQDGPRQTTLADDTDGRISAELATLGHGRDGRYNALRSALTTLQSANNRLAADNAQLAMLLTRSHPESAR